MTVVAQSLNGCLRLNVSKDGKKGVVEIRSHLFPGEWTYCVYRSLPIDRAWELFESQVVWHVDKNKFLEPIVDIGV